MDIEQLETENNELWDAGSFCPDGERVVNELREIADSIED